MSFNVCITETQNNTCYTYHKIRNPMFILNIRNSDITIIASNEDKRLKLICENFEKTNIALRVYKLKNSENCT